MSGKLSNSSEQGSQAANQMEQLRKHIEESYDKIRRLEATVAKYASGYEAVVQDKVREKDQIIQELLDEHAAFIREKDELVQKLTKSNMQMERYRKIVMEARDATEKVIAENRKLRG